MSAAHEYHFTDDCRLSIVQARFEALALGTDVVEPSHLVLGVVKTIAPPVFERLFPDPRLFSALCRALGSVDGAAPVSAADVRYSEQSMEVVAGAMYVVQGSPEPLIGSMHLLIGVHQPRGRYDGSATQASPTAVILDTAGLTMVRLGQSLVVGDDPGA